jgi:phage major head subunit gpT-like protein
MSSLGIQGFQVTPTFLFDFESRMQRITENEFARITLGDNMWWRDVVKVRNTGKRREIIAWLLSTAQIRAEGQGGNRHFENMVAKYLEVPVTVSGEALELDKNQLEDNDGDGFDFASEWSTQMGFQMAYFPQAATANLILNGESTTSAPAAYDGLSYFNTAHPVNPFRSSAGTYANLLTGASSGLYPGALPIDESVSLDQAFVNLGKARAYIASLKMPNGKTPRFLKIRGLMVPPSLVNRAQQLTNARTIAQMAGALSANNFGAGSGDVEAIIRNWNFGQPIEVQEFATGVAADATSWYILTEQVQNTQLGALVYVEREPFSINYYTGMGGGTGVDAILAREQKLQWHCRGRNGIAFGHPYALFKVKAA